MIGKNIAFTIHRTHRIRYVTHCFTDSRGPRTRPMYGKYKTSWTGLGHAGSSFNPEMQRMAAEEMLATEGLVSPKASPRSPE